MTNCTICNDKGSYWSGGQGGDYEYCLCPAGVRLKKPLGVFEAEERRQIGVEQLELLGASIAREINRVCMIVSRLNSLWEIDIRTGETIEPDFPEMLMLTVSELSEALEGHRKDCQDDHLPRHKMFDVEIADAVIRLFHIAARKGIDLGPLIVEKCLYNVARPDHQYAARIAKGGKKI